MLTHQFDQLKEEIIAKEMDLVKESQEKARILKDKDGLTKEIEKVRSESQSAEKNKHASEKEVQKLLGRISNLIYIILKCFSKDREKKLEVEISAKKTEMEKTVSRMEVMNNRLSQKKQEIEVLERKVMLASDWLTRINTDL